MSILAPNPFRPPTAGELFAPLTSRLGLTTLEIHASVQWSASAPKFRELMRAAIEERVKELGCVIAKWEPYPVSVPEKLEAASANDPRSISISISHTKTVGGFALLSSHEGVVGFDIEDVGRVREAVIQRIKHEKDEASTLSPDLLWTAKEAAYKALRGPVQPVVITDIGLGVCENLSEKSALFELKFPEQYQGLGLTLQEKKHALALFILKRST